MENGKNGYRPEEAEKREMSELEIDNRVNATENKEMKDLQYQIDCEKDEKQSLTEQLKKISEQIRDLKEQESEILQGLEDQGKIIELAPLNYGGLNKEKLDELGVNYELDDEGYLSDEGEDFDDKISKALKRNGYQLWGNYTGEGWIGYFSKWIKE